MSAWYADDLQKICFFIRRGWNIELTLNGEKLEQIDEMSEKQKLNSRNVELLGEMGKMSTNLGEILNDKKNSAENRTRKIVKKKSLVRFVNAYSAPRISMRPLWQLLSFQHAAINHI